MSRFVRHALAAAVLAVTAASAQAAPYVASFDPQFGAPFTSDPTLGWRGTTLFDLDDSCLTTPGTVITLAASCSTVTSTVIEFYDFDAASPQATLATVTFTATYSLSRVYFEVIGGVNRVLGIDAEITGYVSPVGDLAVLNDLFNNNIPDFAVEFNLGALGGANDGPYNGPLLYWKRGEGCEKTQCNNTNKFAPDVYTINGFDVPVAEVPEPASLALALAGLAAAGALRRRRAAAVKA